MGRSRSVSVRHDRRHLLQWTLSSLPRPSALSVAHAFSRLSPRMSRWFRGRFARFLVPSFGFFRFHLSGRAAPGLTTDQSRGLALGNTFGPTLDPPQLSRLHEAVAKHGCGDHHPPRNPRERRVDALDGAA
jgi:hypothetical protein